MLTPFREVIIRPRDKPWMTSTIRTAMRKRDRFLRKYRLTNSLTDWNKYKIQRNLTVGIVRKEKSVYGAKACSQIPPIKEFLYLSL